ncbi:hypothetical protein LSH36_1164g00048 [Paralvinella palmiformis]|uniref:G-protein coupled receptors family 1 profile domain-containing protein n=1 Tax=Paralvinella palmiformis TaxID=53620 RepID=A0AAD9MPE3_9ANNE|nr:hypothetical protein LSH36_1164g00048 [Paralvinella palmiformis]
METKTFLGKSAVLVGYFTGGNSSGVTLSNGTIGSRAMNASSEETTPVQPIADVSMPMVRFVCEVVVNIPLALVGIVANILILIVLNRQKKRLTTNVLLQALALADTLILASSILLRSLRYVGWRAFNDLYHYVFVSLYPCVYFFRLADTWITVVMTIDRYIAVCRPLQAHRLCTLRRTYAAIGVIVLATFGFSVPRFFEFRLIDLSVSRLGFVHTPLVANRTYTIAYRMISFFVIMYLIPMVALVALNVRLWYGLRRAYHARDSMISNGSLHARNAEDPLMTSSSRSVTSVVVVIVVVCVLCNVITMTTHVFWILHVCFAGLRYLEKTRRFLANTSNILVTLNSAINFLIYCLVCRKFRLALKRILCCRRHPDSAAGSISRYRSNNTADVGTSSYLLVRIEEKPSFTTKVNLSLRQHCNEEKY